MTDVSSTLVLPPDPAPEDQTTVTIPATPVSGQVTVTGPTPAPTKGTKAQVGTALGLVITGLEIGAQAVPDPTVRIYIMAAVGALGLVGLFFGIYIPTNEIKVSK